MSWTAASEVHASAPSSSAQAVSCTTARNCPPEQEDTGPGPGNGTELCICFTQKVKNDVKMRFFDRNGTLFEDEKPEGWWKWDPNVRESLNGKGLAGCLCFRPWRFRKAFGFEICNDVRKYFGYRTESKTLEQLVRAGEIPKPIELFLKH